ncbi:unnamed protein product [Caretta caretta]
MATAVLRVREAFLLPAERLYGAARGRKPERRAATLWEEAEAVGGAAAGVETRAQTPPPAERARQKMF